MKLLILIATDLQAFDVLVDWKTSISYKEQIPREDEVQYIFLARMTRLIATDLQAFDVLTMKKYQGKIKFNMTVSYPAKYDLSLQKFN